MYTIHVFLIISVVESYSLEKFHSHISVCNWWDHWPWSPEGWWWWWGDRRGCGRHRLPKWSGVCFVLSFYSHPDTKNIIIGTSRCSVMIYFSTEYQCKWVDFIDRLNYEKCPVVFVVLTALALFLDVIIKPIWGSQLVIFCSLQSKTNCNKQVRSVFPLERYLTFWAVFDKGSKGDRAWECRK